MTIFAAYMQGMSAATEKLEDTGGTLWQSLNWTRWGAMEIILRGSQPT